MRMTSLSPVMKIKFLNSVKLSETEDHHTSPWSDSEPEDLILVANSGQEISGWHVSICET